MRADRRRRMVDVLIRFELTYEEVAGVSQ